MTEKLTRSGSLLSGATAGAVAFLAAYVVTFVLVRDEARETFEGTVPTWKVVGWYLYNAHFVDLVSSQSFGAFGGSEAVSLIAESSGTTATLLYGVPPLALLAVGAAVALRLDDGDLTDLALGGAATVLGYGLLAVVGAIAFGHSVEGSFLGVEVAATVSLPLASVVVVVALLYPGVFGTAGAVVAPAVRDAAAG
jgi:hypothetical protein